MATSAPSLRYYPRRSLAAVTGATLLASGITPDVMPRIIAPPVVWEVVFVLAGITLLACAIWPDTPLPVRGAGATLVAVAIGGRVVETILGMLDGRLPFPRTLLNIAALGVIACHSVALLAFWHRLNR